MTYIEQADTYIAELRAKVAELQAENERLRQLLLNENGELRAENERLRLQVAELEAENKALLDWSWPAYGYLRNMSSGIGLVQRAPARVKAGK